MPAFYVTLYRWTDRGVQNITDTVTRARQAIAAAEKPGERLLLLYGHKDDMIWSVSGKSQDEEGAMAFNMNLSKVGNVRTETLRAFAIDEMERMLKKVT